MTKSPAPIFALIDCNNFFVSCERLFRPDLEGRPVVVLSSNDGCAVARSNEAKALGIPMAAPAFKYREVFQKHGVVQFSANFELYGDMSDRMTRLLSSITPRIEVYSVDESFLDLSRLEISNYTAWAKELRARVQRELGLPVSIGIAPSKTLAKLASDRAKKEPALNGVLDLMSLSPKERAPYLERTPIGDTWGVGRRLSPKLKAEGVFTAAQLSSFSAQRAQQLMGIHGRKMVSELNGVSCHPLELSHKVHQTVMHGRMFGEDTAEPHVIESAIAALTARGAYRLRRDGLLARRAVVSLSTNRHKPGYQYLSRFTAFATPTADTGIISRSLLDLVAPLLTSHQAYHRANILLYDLAPLGALQADLFGDVNFEVDKLSQSKLAAVDQLNGRYGPHTIRFAAEDLSQRWQPKRQLRSPRYTSNWQELPLARLQSHAPSTTT